MLILKLAAVTCAFYLVIAVFIEAAAFSLAHLRGAFGFFAPRSAWIGGFGIVWLISFLLAWRIVLTPVLTKIAK